MPVAAAAVAVAVAVQRRTVAAGFAAKTLRAML